jgi:hypothetical protein
MDASIGAPVDSRPLDLGGIISASFRVYRDNYLAFVVILAVYLVPTAIFGELFQPDLDQLGLYALALIVTLLVGVLGNAATIHAAGQAYAGGQAHPAVAYREALYRLASLLGAGFLVLLVYMVLWITVIGIPVSIYFLIRWSMAICAVVLEGKGPRAALSRSTDLVRGNWWRVFGILIVLGLILIGVYILGLISIFIGSAFLTIIEYSVGATEGSATTFASLASTLLNILVGAFSAIGLTVLFQDLRTRKELLGPAPAPQPTALPWDDTPA